jgi:hypothetical protein
MSKGSWYRKVDKKKYDKEYERIFGKEQDHGRRKRRKRSKA